MRKLKTHIKRDQLHEIKLINTMRGRKKMAAIDPKSISPFDDKKQLNAFDVTLDAKAGQASAPDSTMLNLTGTNDTKEQAERVQRMMYAPVIALTIVWDGRMDAVTNIVASANLSPAQIMSMLSDALKFSAASMAQMEQRAKSAQHPDERNIPLPPNDPYNRDSERGAG